MSEEDPAEPARTCPHMSRCEMYALFKNAGTLGAWKALYCKAAFENCKRYELTVCDQPVPSNMMPNGKLLEVRRKRG